MGMMYLCVFVCVCVRGVVFFVGAEICNNIIHYLSLTECRNYKSDLNCERWANTGECLRNTFWMHVQCHKSCYKCDKPPITKGNIFTT